MTEFEQVTQKLQELQDELDTVHQQLVLLGGGYSNLIMYLEHRLRLLECEIIRHQSLQSHLIEKL